MFLYNPPISVYHFFQNVLLEIVRASLLSISISIHVYR